MGMEWRMPLRQSLMRLFLKKTFCLAVSEFWNWPWYDRRIFSYHFSAPTARLRLKGLTCDSEMLKLGKETLRVESWVRCDTFIDALMLHLELGKR